MIGCCIGQLCDQNPVWLRPVQVKALKTLAGVSVLLLSQFESTVDEDRMLLEGGVARDGDALSVEMQLAVRFRMAKKQLLLDAINDLQRRIQARTHVCESTAGDRNSTSHQVFDTNLDVIEDTSHVRYPIKDEADDEAKDN